MPKASPIQTNFNCGEFSPLLYGRVDSERYKTGLATCFNYINTLQGPIVRRPGTKYVTDVKDPSKPPALIPFQFSASQGYVLEFGDHYMRFCTNNGQVLTNTTVFQIHGVNNIAMDFYSTRDNKALGFGESVLTTGLGSSSVGAGAILELETPYGYADVQGIKWAQQADTLYLSHPNYPPYKLQRRGQTFWDLKQIYFQDGPFLPLNSYSSIGDSLGVRLKPSGTAIGTISASKTSGDTAGTPITNVTAASAGSTGLIQITSNGHGYSSGDRIFISGVVGTTEANNIASGYWLADVIDVNTINLRNSVYTNAYISAGTLFYALFQFDSSAVAYDLWVTGSSAAKYSGRVIGLYCNGGYRCWGEITSVTNSGQAGFRLRNDFNAGDFLPSASSALIWQMGTWSRLNGFPTAVTFHQNRLTYGGPPGNPQEFDASYAGQYEVFSVNNSGSSSPLTVTDAHGLSFKLNSDQLNKILWMKSNAQGLLAGTGNAEWQITPNTQAGILTPTNISANQTSFFGSADMDAVQMGSATLYAQRAQRKIRELHFFFQVGTFRSTDLTELSEHITIPSITKLAVQKENIPIAWGVRSDGILTSMTYNRDDTTLKVGWARHQIGGQSDPSGTNAIVKSIAVITSSSAVFDELWMTTQRSINGTSVLGIECMTRVWDDSIPQEDAYHFDYGGTYDSPVAITGVTNTGSCLVTASGHGFNNGSSVQIVGALGLNKSVTDINGNITSSSLVNYRTFLVTSSATNSFYLTDFSGNFIISSSYSSYISGGSARKLVNHISGLTWLKGETVGVLADGAIHPDTVVDSSGTIALSFPAAKVQVGYRYNSDGKLLRNEAGSADGSSIGKTRRVTRVAVQFHKVGDFAMGMDFTALLPVDFRQADQQLADTAIPLWSGVHRDGIESGYDFDGQLCFRQSTGLPGMVQSFTVMLEEVDV